LIRKFDALFASSQYLPLDLIPTVSSKLRVDEKTTARRFFFGDGSAPKGIICLRKHENSKWLTQWCELSNAMYEKQVPHGFTIPLMNKRIIPAAMVPCVPDGGAQPVELDQRWWDGLRKVPIAAARTPFSRMPLGEQRLGFAHRTNDKIYIALP
jgi:hypothetical protein